MKKYLPLILSIIFTLTIFSACEARPDSTSQSPSSASVSEADEPSSMPDEEPSEASDDESESEASEPEESGYTYGPYDEILLTYGGTVEYPSVGEPYLRTSAVGFYFLDDWEGAENIEAGSFYSFYLSMMWKEDISQEEKEEKYKSPVEGDTGWFFPEDIYEAKVREYFDVSVEHLRSERYIYDPELRGYYLGGGGGIGERPMIELTDAVKSGDTVSLHITLLPSGISEGEKKILTVQMLPDGGYRFLSYKSV